MLFPMIAVAASLAGASTDPIKSEPLLEINRCEIGDIYAHSIGSCVLTFENKSDHAIEVGNFTQPLKKIVSFVPEKFIVEPHSAAYVKLTVDVANSAGNTRFPFQFHTTEKGHSDRLGAAYAFAISTLDDPRPEIDLGSFDYDSTVLPKGSVVLSSHDATSFRITGILESPKYLAANIEGENTLSAQMLPGAPWGLYEAYIKVSIDSPHQKEAWVSVKANVLGEVRSEGTIALGVMRKGAKNERLIRVSSRDNKDFKIKSLELKGVEGSVSQVPCEPKAHGCQMIRLAVSDKQALGMMTGSISIELPEFHQSLPVSVWGLFLSKEAKVEKISDLTKKGDLQSSGVQAREDLVKDIRSAVAKNDTEKLPDLPSGKGPLLRWRVSNSMPVYGFQIFRSDTERGPYVLLNSIPIHSDASDAGDVSYQWRDATSEPGHVYWYYIGLLNKDGSKQRLSPNQRVEAK